MSTNQTALPHWLASTLLADRDFAAYRSLFSQQKRDCPQSKWITMLLCVVGNCDQRVFLNFCSYIKMSSPNINNIMVVGCIMCYSCVFLFGADFLLESTQPEAHSTLCKVRWQEFRTMHSLLAPVPELSLPWPIKRWVSRESSRSGLAGEIFVQVRLSLTACGVLQIQRRIHLSQFMSKTFSSHCLVLF